MQPGNNWRVKMSDMSDNLKLIDNPALRHAMLVYLDFLWANHKAAWPTLFQLYYNDRPGLNVVRVVADGHGQRHVHSFVVLRDYSSWGKDWKAGDILKPAGWKQPTFNAARGNILTSDYKNVSWVGTGYLR